MDKTVIKAKVATQEIAFLVQVIEGYSHIGVLTTTDPKNGEVVLQVTPDTYGQALEILRNMPIDVEVLDD